MVLRHGYNSTSLSENKVFLGPPLFPDHLTKAVKSVALSDLSDSQPKFGKSLRDLSLNSSRECSNKYIQKY